MTEGEPKVRPHVPASRWWLFGIIAVGGLFFDLATKSVIFAELGEPGPDAFRPVLGTVVELRTSHNKGALWGFGGSLPYGSMLFAGLSLVAAGAILWWLFARGGAADRGLTVALALIMAGALGNCYDRVVYGHVRDFVHVHVDSMNFNWPIFNFADNFLVAGAALLVVMALRPEPAPAPVPPPA